MTASQIRIRKTYQAILRPTVYCVHAGAAVNAAQMGQSLFSKLKNASCLGQPLPFSHLLVTLMNNVIFLFASLRMMPFSVEDFMPVFIYVCIFMYFLQA